MLLTMDELRHRLSDRRLVVVAERTGVNYRRLLRLVDGVQAAEESDLKALTEYLEPTARHEALPRSRPAPLAGSRDRGRAPRATRACLRAGAGGGRSRAGWSRCRATASGRSGHGCSDAPRPASARRSRRAAAPPGPCALGRVLVSASSARGAHGALVAHITKSSRDMSTTGSTSCQSPRSTRPPTRTL